MKILIVTVIVVCAFIIGGIAGQAHYKSGCEKLGNAQGQVWYECNAS